MGVVSKVAVRQFINAKRMDHRGLKKESRSELMKSIQTYATKRKYLFKTKPRKHQLVGMLLILAMKKFLLFFEMGLGKSKTMLDAMALLIKNGKIKRVLIVVENLTNIDEFDEQVKSHTTLKCCELLGSSEQRWKTLYENEDSHFFVINYTGLQAMLSMRPKKSKSKAKPGRKINPRLLKELSSFVDAVLLDESQNVKNQKTVNFKMLRPLMKAVPYRVAATGTPIGKDPLGFWSQFFIVDEGETLGKTLGFFKACFYKEEVNRFSPYPEYVFDKKNEKILNKIIQNRSLEYSDSEVEDLPPRIDIRVPIVLRGETLEYYKLLEKGLIESKGDYIKCKSAFIRMRQVCSGFLSWDDLEGDKVSVEFESNAKLEWLQAYIHNQLISSNSKIVVFHFFQHSARLINRMLGDMGVKYASLNGSVRDKKAQKEKFKNDKTCRVLVSFDKAAGLNLQKANKAVFFDFPLGLIKFKQLLKRLHRIGQTKRTYLYFLLGKGTIEEEQYEAALKGQDFFNIVVKGIHRKRKKRGVN